MSVTIPEADGCPWPIDAACLSDDWETNYDEATKTRSIALASATLRRLTAFRVGGCPITVRPVTEQGCVQYGLGRWGMDAGFVPYQGIDGQWRNAWCGYSGGHAYGKSVRLTPPVYDVTVTVDGDDLTEGTDFWISGDRVIRLGIATWPMTQNLDLPDTEPGTFSITYTNSYPVDGMGAYAAGKLAMQYAKACKTGKCDLPSTVTQLVRQGATYNLPAGAFPNGETGIREVDAYIALWNPAHRKQGPRVWA